MKIIKTDTKIKPYIPNYISDNASICFLDIETDGLSHFYNKIVLIGLHIVNRNGTKVVQLFSDTNTESDEKNLLIQMSRVLSDENIEVIYTYNGATFDMPFIRKKLKFYSINSTFTDIAHIDLIKTIRAKRKTLELDNCKLKTIEKHIGINREDTISGKDSVLLYIEYLKTKSPALQKTILKHNYEDILYLNSILELEDSLRTDEKMIITLNNQLMIELISTNNKRDTINIKANILNRPSPYQIYATNYHINIDAISKTFEINIMTNNCRISSEGFGKYLDISNEDPFMYNLANSKNNYGLNLPENIVLLSIEENILWDNVKKLLMEIIKS